MIPIFLISLLITNCQDSSPSIKVNSQETTSQFVQNWSDAIKKSDWKSVYELGSPYLNSSKGLSHPGTSRFIGFTWFAAYFESRAGRADENPLEAIKRASSLIPDQHEVWYEFGAELNRNQRYKAAIPVLQKYLKDEPSNLDGQYELAYSYNGANRAIEALPILQFLQKQSPDNPHVLSELAFSLNALHMAEAAKNILLKLVELRPDDYGAWVELSQAYRMLDQWDLALSAIDKSESLGLSPKQAKTERGLIASKKKAKWVTSIK